MRGRIGAEWRHAARWGTWTEKRPRRSKGGQTEQRGGTALENMPQCACCAGSAQATDGAGAARSAARSADGGLAVPWRISVERQRGADDPLGPAMGPRVQLVVDGRLLLSLMLDRRLVGEEGHIVGGIQEQAVGAPPLHYPILLSLV